MPEEIEDLKGLIALAYPQFLFGDSPKPSGQRLVIFGSFSDVESEEIDGFIKESAGWGDVVLKASFVKSRTSISYLEKEIEVLKNLDSSFFPKLYFNEILTHHPETEEPFSYPIIITVEERVDAVPLSDRIHDLNSEKAVIDFFENIIKAMKLLWLPPLNLVHRDLKPDNILLKEDGSIVIIDLGILREEGVSGVTNSLLAFGPCTPSYASPEQAMNDKRNISFKSDLFSLAIIGYEMISGKNPFLDEGNNYFDDVLKRVVELVPPSLSDFNSSDRFSAVVEKMMEKKPYKRYRTVGALSADLEFCKGIKDGN